MDCIKMPNGNIRKLPYNTIFYMGQQGRKVPLPSTSVTTTGGNRIELAIGADSIEFYSSDGSLLVQLQADDIARIVVVQPQPNAAPKFIPILEGPA